MDTSPIANVLSHLTVLSLMVFTGACQPPDTGDVKPLSAAPPSAGAIEMSAPTLAELEQATYTGVIDVPVRLTAGTWQDEPFADGGASRLRIGLDRDIYLTGDLDGDGAGEAVVLLWSNSGGSGTFDYLAVVGRSATGVPLNLATASLGDRVSIHDARIDGERIVIDVVETGPDDPKCCPGQKARRIFALSGASLNEISSTDLGRLSIADLAGVEWTLIEFDRDDPVPEDIEITLRLDGNRIGGKSACNLYGGGVTEGRLPGAVTIDMPMTGTLMACPPPADEYERRYLEKLQGVTRFSFVTGNLALTWRDGERNGTMMLIRDD